MPCFYDIFTVFGALEPLSLESLRMFKKIFMLRTMSRGKRREGNYVLLGKWSNE
jgi:hypothetical protein